jgi:biopolymer transport protein ExbB/TolQ
MDFTIVQMWANMGMVAKLVVAVLAVMSVLTVGVTIERWLAYRRAEEQSRAFALVVTDLLAKKLFTEATEAAAQFQGSHIAPVIRSGLSEFLLSVEVNKKNAAFDVHGAVKRSIERTTERQMANLRRGLSVLASVGSTAPFVGLFGTTFGIINSFQGMAKEGGGGLGAVAAGIAEALVTTAVGILVATVAVLIYNYFTSKIETLEVDTHESAGEVVALLAREHASR